MADDDAVVNLTPTCAVRGRRISSSFVFLGVPYAQAPIGDLRFNDPKPIELWSGVRDAKQFGPVCPQNFKLLDDFPFPVTAPKNVSEDCLVLNIYSPSTDDDGQLRPVMVFIHGGGFNCGYSNFYDGRRLSSLKNVVVVIINYRVGILGFACSGDSCAPGNYGILDQIEALKWIQRYIAKFGGNPNNVTIFGESAGAVSVSLLVVSPPAQGLFQRAIMQSGTLFLGIIAGTPPEKAGKYLRSCLAPAFPDFPVETATSSELFSFLRRQPYDVLAQFGDSFSAVVDGRVLVDRPDTAYSVPGTAARPASGRGVDLLIGCNAGEGHMVYKILTNKLGKTADSGTTGAAEMARSFFTSFAGIFTSVENAGPTTIVDSLMEEYFAGRNESSWDESRDALIEALGDSMFVVPTIRAANCHTQAGNRTFMYYFCYRPSFAWYPPSILSDHAVDLFFLFDTDMDIEYTEDDDRVRRMMLSYWANFATTGDPNGEEMPSWPEYDQSTQKYLRIELAPSVDTKLKAEKFDYWVRRLPDILKSE